MSTDPILCGWLLKLGEKGITNRWKTRWFELRNKSELHYFVSNDMANPSNVSKGFIDLMKAVTVIIEERDKKVVDGRYVFHIHLKERDYVLAASNEEDRQMWNNKICEMFVQQGKPKKNDAPLSPRSSACQIEIMKNEISQLKTEMEKDKSSHQAQIEELKKSFEEWKTVKEKEIGELKAMVYKANFPKIFTSPKLVSEREPTVEDIVVVTSLQPMNEFTTVEQLPSEMSAEESLSVLIRDVEAIAKLSTAQATE